MKRYNNRDRSRSRGAGGKGGGEAGGAEGAQSGQYTMISKEVERFLIANAHLNVEERTADKLRKAPPEIQSLVMRRGNLDGTRDPNAVLITRIRNSMDGLKPVPEGDKKSAEVERFLSLEFVEPHAAAKLRRASKIVQDAVIARGSLAGTRDPTAVLMARIRDGETKYGPTDKSSSAAAELAAIAAGAVGATGEDSYYSGDLYSSLAAHYGEEYARAYITQVSMAQMAQYQQFNAYEVEETPPDEPTLAEITGLQPMLELADGAIASAEVAAEPAEEENEEEAEEEEDDDLCGEDLLTATMAALEQLRETQLETQRLPKAGASGSTPAPPTQEHKPWESMGNAY